MIGHALLTWLRQRDGLRLGQAKTWENNSQTQICRSEDLRYSTVLESMRYSCFWAGQPRGRQSPWLLLIRFECHPERDNNELGCSQ